MKITSRLKNSSTLSVALLMLMIPVLFWSYHRSKIAEQNVLLANKIHVSVFALSSARDQFLLNRDERSRSDWSDRNQSAGRLLSQAERQFKGRANPALIAAMKGYLQEGAALFAAVVRTSEAIGAGGGEGDLSREREEIFIGRMLSSSSDLQDAASNLESLATASVEREYQVSIFFTALFVLLVVVVTVINSTLVNGLLRARLRAIHRGSEIIAGGNLDYRLDCQHSDEFADLARTINGLAEKAQYFGEERFREIFNQAPLGIALSDSSTGRIYEANLRYAEIAGRTVEQLLEVGWLEITHADDLQQDLDAMARMSAGETSGFTATLRYLRPDGSSVWIDKTIAPVTSKQSGGARHLCMIADVSERMQAETKMVEKRKFLETITATTPDVLYFYNTSQRANLYINKEVASLLGYSAEDMVAYEKYPQLNNIHPDDLSLVRRHIQELAETSSDGIHTLEYRIRGKSGSYLWLNVRERVYQRDEQGKPRVLFGIAQDITARKLSELELVSSERRFRELLENVHQIAVTLDREGNITFCNDFLCQLTGWSKEEIAGANWFELFIPEELQEYVRKVFRKGISQGILRSHYENRIVCRDGKLVSIVWNNSMLHNSDNTVAGVASLGIDVTEHRSMEDQLRQSQKMEAIGLLAGGVAHDFNNSLTVIMGYGNLLKSDSELVEQDAEAVEQILDAAERASQLTSGLLAFSRKQEMHRQQVDVNDIVQHVQKFLVRIIGEDVHCRLQRAEAQLPVWVDSGQIEQVLMNLCTNARDAMPKGGVLLIGTELLEIDHRFVSANGYGTPGSYAVVTVSDNGTGIEKRDQSRIFEPFFTTKEVGKGTGLGMAIVYGIVQQHDGFIDVYSEPGQGTAVKVYLPIFEMQPEGAEELLPPAPATGGSETILVAEDEPSVRKLVETVLRKHGYRVILAEDGQDCLEKFTASQGGVDLLLLDIVMPKKNGIETYAEISKLQPEVKVLYSSGYTADFIEKRGMIDQEITILMKPVKPLELLRMVREVLDR